MISTKDGDLARKPGRGFLMTMDVLERIFVIAVATPFFLAFWGTVGAHPIWLLLLTSEGLNVLMVLIRKPGQVAITPYTVIIAMLGTALSLLVRPWHGIALIPLWLSGLGLVLGVSLSICSKLVLNRRFGIIPANRGIASWGPYRLVRHPMYLGYIMTQSAYMLANFNLLTLLIYGAAWTCQVLRIIEEERLLMRDEQYRAFAARTRWRLIPGVF